MRIAFVTNSVPFPARHGVELPLEHFIRHLSHAHEVDLVVTGTTKKDRAEFEARRTNVPATVRAVRYLPVLRPRRLPALAREILGIRPAFELQGRAEPVALRAVAAGDYDAFWFSPIGSLGLLKLMRAAGLAFRGRLAVGLNDASYMLYARGLRHILRGRVAGEWWRIGALLRVPWIALYERRYLKGVDLVHVQTPLEQARVSRLFALLSHRPRFVCIQNGRDTAVQPGEARASDGRTVLFMTHLARGRKNESRWFLDHVWPKVLARMPEARLWLVGSPPDDPDAFAHRLPANVDVRGFVPDLDAVFAGAAVAVVPTLHNSGWVNRISDYFQAGLPVVACSEPASTITGLVPGIHALCADSAGDFADRVAELLADRAAARRLGAAGRSLAESFPTWTETAARVERALIDVVGHDV